MSHASEYAAVAFFKGQEWGMNRRIDAEHFLQQEQEHLETVTRLGIESRSRPSVLLPVLASGGWALGAVASCAPPKVAFAIAGALQNALSEQYNDHIRELRDSGELENVNGLRVSLLKLRDSPRAPEGSPQPADILFDSNLRTLSLEGAVGAAVKFSFMSLAGISRKI